MRASSALLFSPLVFLLACGSAGGTDASSGAPAGGTAGSGQTGKGGKGGGKATGGATGTGGATSSTGGASDGAGGASDGGASAAGGPGVGGSAGSGPSCAPDAPDSATCPCSGTAPHKCYPSTADVKTRGVGTCKDGMQACQGASELGQTWGPCVGATTPVAELCTNGLDDNCDGLVDCKDPTCSTDPSCAGACNNGDTRSCYAGPAGTLGVGPCAAGKQTCTAGAWPTDCPGQVLPGTEACTGAVDTNCNGKVGCADPTCAASPGCVVDCKDGDVQPCYTGPNGTLNVGTCHAGMRTCTGGHWPVECPGELLPAGNETCNDLKDHNCNGFKGCDDIFACLLDTMCMNGVCKAPSPGCVCPVGTGDAATCPEGFWGTSNGGGLGTGLATEVECCPCTANDCGKGAACCGETVCKGSAWCSNVTCSALPAKCNGQVDFDCDFEDIPTDMPEDCDEPCCKCRPPCP